MDCFISFSFFTALFAFSVYDTDRSDTMDTDETNAMLKDIYGKYYSTSEHGKTLNKKIQRLGKNGLARQQFQEFAADNPELLEVPNKYLRQVCARTLGESRWQELTAVRQMMNHSEFMDLYDFLSLLNSKTGSHIQFVTLAEHTESVSGITSSHHDESVSQSLSIELTFLTVCWCTGEEERLSEENGNREEESSGERGEESGAEAAAVETWRSPGLVLSCPGLGWACGVTSGRVRYEVVVVLFIVMTCWFCS